MPLSSKFLTESTGDKIVKIDQYLAKIWTKCNSLLFGPPCRSPAVVRIVSTGWSKNGTVYGTIILHPYITESCGF